MLARLLGAGSTIEDGAPALVRPSGSAISRGALSAAVSRAAGQLVGLGVTPGIPVAIAARDPAAFLVAALATFEAGGIAVPLDTRPGAAPDELADRAHAAHLVRGADERGELQVEPRAGGAPLDPRAAMILFTSGSSGKPKGVLLSGAGLRANVEAILTYLPVREFGRTALTLPLSYSYALVGQAITTLSVGGTLLLLGSIPYPALQLEAMTELGATGLSTVPTALRLHLSALLEEGLPAPPLGYVASAGGPLDVRTAASLRRAFPRARIFNQYGLTEASPRVAAIEDSDPAFARGAAGRPLPGIEVWSDGPDGEICVRGPSVMLGYLDAPEATAQVLSAGGVLRTGDLGHLDETGALFVRGRTDGVVKVAGERVGLEEVAVVLREAGARDAAVVAVPDERLDHRLVAYVEAAADAVARIRAAAMGRLTAARRPSRVVPVAALPRLPSGKVDRQELRRRALAEELEGGAA